MVNSVSSKNIWDIQTAVIAEELRLSHFLVFSDLEPYGIPKVLVMSTRTGMIKSIERGLWAAINGGDIEQLSQSEQEDLFRNKILVPKIEDERAQVVADNKQFVNDSGLFKLVVQPTAACPLGCGYCGQDHSSKHMTPENQQYLVRFATEQLSKGSFKNMHVGWFGAEPLASFQTLESISYKLQALADEYALPYSANIVTNGLLLNEKLFLRLAKNHKLTAFEITLDGLAIDHDMRRPTKGGQGSFERIYRNLLAISKVKPENVAIVIRCNVDARNRNSISQLIEKLAADNLQDKIGIYFAQIHSWGNDAHKQSAEKEEFASWEIDWLCQLIERGFKVNTIPPRKKQVCLAVNDKNFLVDPFGGVFGCTEVSLVNTYVRDSENIHQLGHVKESHLSKSDRRKVFGDYNNTIGQGNTPCSSCRVLPLCGGHCPKAWVEGKEIPCPSFKYNMEERMVLAYLQKCRSSC